MVRLITAVVLILTVVACVCAAPGQTDFRRASYSVTSSGGSLGLGHVSGGTFGDGSFSIGHGGNSPGRGHAGHGGNHGTNSYGGPGGDSGHTSYA